MDIHQTTLLSTDSIAKIKQPDADAFIAANELCRTSLLNQTTTVINGNVSTLNTELQSVSHDVNTISNQQSINTTDIAELKEKIESIYFILNNSDYIVGSFHESWPISNIGDNSKDSAKGTQYVPKSTLTAEIWKRKPVIAWADDNVGVTNDKPYTVFMSAMEDNKCFFPQINGAILYKSGRLEQYGIRMIGRLASQVYYEAPPSSRTYFLYTFKDINYDVSYHAIDCNYYYMANREWEFKPDYQIYMPNRQVNYAKLNEHYQTSYQFRVNGYASEQTKEELTGVFIHEEHLNDVSSLTSK